MKSTKHHITTVEKKSDSRRFSEILAVGAWPWRMPGREGFEGDFEVGIGTKENARQGGVAPEMAEGGMADK